MSGFGFEVPQGDPGALEAASSSWRGLGLALISQGETMAGSAELALGAGSWEGPAASAFSGGVDRLMGVFKANADASAQAASALSDLAQALEQAQQIARQALAAAGQAQEALGAHRQAADEAGRAADQANAAAAAATHPAVAEALSRQANQARGEQAAANAAAGQAQGDLSAAQSRGQQAVADYEHQAQAIAGRLNAAGAQMRPAPDLGQGWADSLVTWLGHVNDYAGAGSVALVKGYESTIAIAASKLADETEEVLGDSSALAAMDAGEMPAAFDGLEPDPAWNLAAGARQLAENPITRGLTTGLPEETWGALSKVPFLAWAMTAVDMGTNWDQGAYKAVVEPLGNLAAGTYITETVSSAVAPAIADTAATLAAGDGVVAALAGTALIPGVGEFVIVGGIAVLGVYELDRVADLADIPHYVDVAADAVDHGLDVAAHATVGVGKSIVHDAGQAIHDAEPWNWG